MTSEPEVTDGGDARRTSDDVAASLRARIRAGELKVGAKLPTQAWLVEHYGVERTVVRQALQQLHGEGLITEGRKGAPAKIASAVPAASRPADEEPKRTAAVLSPRVAEAFRAKEVRIDAVCLTTETLNLALGEPLGAIHAGAFRPDSVHFRILLPDRGINLAFPRPVHRSADGDQLVHERWLRQRNTQGLVLHNNLEALHIIEGIDVRIEFQALPLTSPIKLYLLNGSEALFGYYDITAREQEIADTSVEIYDSLGNQSMLFQYLRSGGSRDAAFVERSQRWFDGVWNTITSELKLS
ncbi:GntR family transcriptional regulator [Streptomyces sp. BPTC-684]|uniref:winged helix-turn-helix domain-containing protein n=1 Tax=Streptomyces sp. BPTC-684 TaxID=3043734 RepID=UPI0024B11BEF|nr:GntR family transcriptional regulator [Streptomyces sp. BPTC-684]WHM38038.1 GntR family transcriptional regulator [Streptomyces sp. BPTC-684]